MGIWGLDLGLEFGGGSGGQMGQRHAKKIFFVESLRGALPLPSGAGWALRELSRAAWHRMHSAVSRHGTARHSPHNAAPQTHLVHARPHPSTPPDHHAHPGHPPIAAMQLQRVVADVIAGVGGKALGHGGVQGGAGRAGIKGVRSVPAGAHSGTRQGWVPAAALCAQPLTSILRAFFS